MPEPSASYLIDANGQVVAAKPEETDELRATGYVPAGAQQIEDFKREQAFHAKYGTTGQQIKTGAEGAAQALTLGTSTFLEKHLLGVNPEDIKGRQEENPGSHTIGTGLSVAVPLLLSGGAAAPLEAGAAGAEGAVAAGTEGASALSRVAGYTAPGLISKLGEATSEGVSGLLGEGGNSLAGRLAAKAVEAGAGSGIEGTAYGLGQVVHEKSLGDPNLTASRAIEEIGLSGLLGFGIGGATGALGQLVGEAASSKLGAKLDDWANTFEGNQNIKTAAGPGKGQSALKWLYKKMSPGEASKLGQEAGDLGLIGGMDSPSSVFEKSNAMMDDVGPRLSGGLREVDALPTAKPIDVSDVVDRMRKEVLAPIDGDPAQEAAARVVRKYIDGYQDSLESVESKASRASEVDAHMASLEEKAQGRIAKGLSRGESPAEEYTGSPATTTLTDLHQARTSLGKSIYGLNGDMTVSTAQKEALQDLRSIISDEIEKGIGKSGADTAGWRALNRQYSVAASINHIAEKGTASAGLSGIPLSAILTSGAGLVHGGPLGAAALGGATMLAKRFGPQALAAGARAVRHLVDDGAAEGLASRTADAIAEARQAGQEVGGATRAASVWGHITDKLGEPLGGPTKDFLRDSAQEHLAHQEQGTPVETVAALSQLERANQRVGNRINDSVSALVRGAPRVARGEAIAGVSGAFTRPPTEAHSSFAKKADRIRQLAANPQMMMEHLDRAASDVREHAPDTAAALQVGMSRCVAVLNQSLPPQPPHAPLEKPFTPSPDQVAKFQRCYEAVAKPTSILKQAAAGTLTPDSVAAAQAAHPQAFAAMQTALLAKLSSHRAPVPYAQRQMISLIMGRDMDGTSTPAMIQASQAAFSTPPEQSQSGIKPTSKGMEKLTLANRMQTPSQAAASRGLDK